MTQKDVIEKFSTMLPREREAAFYRASLKRELEHAIIRLVDQKVKCNESLQVFGFLAITIDDTIEPELVVKVNTVINKSDILRQEKKFQTAATHKPSVMVETPPPPSPGQAHVTDVMLQPRVPGQARISCGMPPPPAPKHVRVIGAMPPPPAPKQVRVIGAMPPLSAPKQVRVIGRTQPSTALQQVSVAGEIPPLLVSQQAIAFDGLPQSPASKQATVLGGMPQPPVSQQVPVNGVMSELPAPQQVSVMFSDTVTTMSPERKAVNIEPKTFQQMHAKNFELYDIDDNLIKIEQVLDITTGDSDDKLLGEIGIITSTPQIVQSADAALEQQIVSSSQMDQVIGSALDQPIFSNPKMVQSMSAALEQQIVPSPQMVQSMGAASEQQIFSDPQIKIE